MTEGQVREAAPAVGGIDPGACRRLWRSVLLNGLRSHARAVLVREAGGSPHAEDLEYPDTPGFEDVCHHAGVDCAALRRRLEAPDVLSTLTRRMSATAEWCAWR